jgi:hypothetical protein
MTNLIKKSTNHGKNVVMKVIFTDMDDLYNLSYTPWATMYRQSEAMGGYFEQLEHDFLHHFPFVKGIKLHLESDETLYKKKQLFINTHNGISSPFEAVLHELAHCLYFVDKNKLERVRFLDFGLSKTINNLPKALMVNAFNNELMAGAYQMKMMKMAGLSEDTISRWLEGFSGSFSSDIADQVDTLKKNISVSEFGNKVVEACNSIMSDHVKKSLKVLAKCFKSDKLNEIGE